MPEVQRPVDMIRSIFFPRTGRGWRLLGAAIVCAALAAPPGHAFQPYVLSGDRSDVIGELSLTTSVHEDTLSDLARAYSQGYKEMRLANPGIDPWIPGEGAEIVVPNLYVLPAAPREGIVINVPEMRMYLYKRGAGQQTEVLTFPVSIGRQQWTTPHGATSITAKVRDPAWYPPASIREEHAAEGRPLPNVVPAGPDNPLGAHALRLGIPGYLIHGTNKPYGIGMRVTHGCVRMYPKDVATVYDLAAVGTQVRIVNQPYKVGLAHGRIYLEVHPHLDEDEDEFDDQYSLVVKLILERVKGLNAQLVWAGIRRVIDAKDGVPQVVGTVKPKLEARGQDGARIATTTAARR